MSKPPLEIFVASPRGFCAGVERAIKIVEATLKKWGPPVYVRHEIVHNRRVVEGLMEQGAVFVEDLAECPDGRPVVFSAHGAPKSVHEKARARGMCYIDATCPLVSKVHIETVRNSQRGLQTVMVGRAGHPETIGTMGQVPDGDVLLVEDVEDVYNLVPRDPDKLAFVTQTTLSVDDTDEVTNVLAEKFPGISGPHKSDICYATTNRQNAVKAIAPKVGALFVIGSPNSSNSRRLTEVGWKAGCSFAQLIQGVSDIDWIALEGVRSIGLTAGASAPEVIVDEVKNAFAERYDVTFMEVKVADESVEFKVPRELQVDVA